MAVTDICKKVNWRRTK